MQYWINHNGVQSGPVDLEAIKEMGLTSAAYVWHEGLTDWMKITQLPELQGMYEMVGEPVQPQATSQAAPQANPSNEAVTGHPYQQPQQPRYNAPQQQPGAQYGVQQPGATEPCPPSNLVWAIISTLLCCLPAGIVAIVYALKVMNKYRDGDIEGAKRASETGAWWCIAAIVLGILALPFSLIMSGIKDFMM